MKNITNSEISSLFQNMATSLILQDERKNMFRILAYKKAADIVRESSEEFFDKWREKKLDNIPGIGQGMKSHLDELFKTGKVKEIDSQIKKYPQSVYFLQNIRGIGPKTALVLSRELKDGTKKVKVKDVDEKIIVDKVIQLCKEHKIAKLPGFGEKSEKDILQSVLRYSENTKKEKRINLADALSVAEKFVEYMEICAFVKQIEVLGSLRRKNETIGDIDIAASSFRPEEVIKHFVSYKYASSKIQEGENKAAIELNNGMRVDFRVVSPDQWGTMLAHFTGSKDHNVALREYALKKKLSISEWGVKGNQGDKEDKGIKTFRSEEEFYKFLGLQYIPPEIRENTGEIELALKNKLPKLIELKDIKGDFHLHSKFNIETSHDLGSNTFEEMIEKAMKLGYKYMSFSEHNPSMSKNSKTQKSEILKKKQDQVNRLNQRYRGNPYVFNSLEVDILPDGNLAIEEEHLNYLDFIIVSIHSSFEQNSELQTKRILKALNFPKVKIFGHPTGRLVQKRDEIKFDHEAVFSEVAKRNIAVEISASPYRNDLNWREIIKLKNLDISYIINTDSHSLEEMDLMKYGVWNARKGWMTADNIVNTKSLGYVRKFMLS